ncbi:CYTH and CHAD domain-containing protein [Gordonia soli]|uniref:CHAD domain-containing protein n=1 Tax=Gordonia soli NBRC 108243 TaxID=1223545 RepID=M0QMG9_9ACTN|nr:CYTH and CHAD domain-containing protein [Gordonia soli]GAC69476.1 hypothetical protein GS4_25_00470 [Gordonia soli NBRC 108243]
MPASEQLEVELKFDVDAGHPAPDLRVLPGVVATSEPETFALDATYFDTENLDLASNRVTLRRRTGGTDEGWHLKRPAGPSGARRETQIGFDTASADGDVPDELTLPVRALIRTRHLIPVAAISTSRTVTTLFGAGQHPIAVLCEDLVTARSLLPNGRHQEWSEWEFELVGDTDNTKLLKAAGRALQKAGAREASSASKLARAIGTTPDVVAPHLGKRPTALDLVITDIAIHRNSLIAYDPLVRIDAPDAVHQMRVATRRLRSILTGYPGVLDTEHTAHINDELKLLARILGDARDSEVQIEIGAKLLRDEPASPDLHAALIDAEESAHARAIRAAQAAMESTRYFALLDAIDELIADPLPGPEAEVAASEAVDKAIAKSRKKIAQDRADLSRLREGSAEWEEHLHTIRKRAKQMRYRADAADPLDKKKYRTVAKAAKEVQSALGDFNDSRINRARLAEIAATGSLGPQDMFVLGRIDARQEFDGERAISAYRSAARRL